MSYGRRNGVVIAVMANHDRMNSPFRFSNFIVENPKNPSPIAKKRCKRANSTETFTRLIGNLLPSTDLIMVHNDGRKKMPMHAVILTKQQAASITSLSAAGRMQDTIETRLWLEEHDWLYALLKSGKNVAPTFRCPDLISACVSLVFANGDALAHIFGFLGTELILRAPHSPRRRESMWMPQYELLLAIQRSPANQHPNPKFQLDQLTTACVALSRKADPSGVQVLRQSRINMANRIARMTKPHATD